MLYEFPLVVDTPCLQIAPMYFKTQKEQALAYRVRHEIKKGGRRGNISTKEQKCCNMDFGILSFVVKRNVKFTIPPNQQEKMHVRSRNVALWRFFNIKFNRKRITEVVFKVWIICGHYFIDVPVKYYDIKLILSCREQILLIIPISKKITLHDARGNILYKSIYRRRLEWGIRLRSSNV